MYPITSPTYTYGPVSFDCATVNTAGYPFTVYSDEAHIVALSRFGTCFVCGSTSAVFLASFRLHRCARGERITTTDTGSFHSLPLMLPVDMYHRYVMR